MFRQFRRPARPIVNRRRRLTLEYLEDRTVPTFFGGVNVAVAGGNIFTAPASGVRGEVRVYDSTGNYQLQSFLPFDEGFTGGVNVAAAVVGNRTVLATAPSTGVPQVRVFDVKANAVLADFMAYDAAFTGGVSVAVGDLNGDGNAEVVTGAGPGGSPLVRIYNTATGQFTGGFLAFDQSFTGGVNVALGDVTGDGILDIVAGAGAGGTPIVNVYNGRTLALITSFLAFDPSFTGGVNVAAGSGRPEVVVGAGKGGAPLVRTFNVQTQVLSAGINAYDGTFAGGVNVAVGVVGTGEAARLVTGADVGGGAQVRTFSSFTSTTTSGDFLAYGGLSHDPLLYALNRSVDYVSREAALFSEVGIFAVDNIFGAVGNLMPGDAGYAAAALAESRRQMLFARTDDSGGTTPTPATHPYVGYYLIQGSTAVAWAQTNSANRIDGTNPVAFFSFSEANPDGFDHVRLQVSAGRVVFGLGFEDLTNGGDKDYNDAVLGNDPSAPRDTVSPTVTISSPSQNQTFSANPAIVGTATDNVRVVAVEASTDNGAFTSISFTADTGAFTFTPSVATDGTANGAHTVAFRARDAAGNVSATASFGFTLAAFRLTAGLSAASDTGTPGNNITELSTVTVTGVTAANATVALVGGTLTTTADASGNYSLANVPLVAGKNDLNIRATSGSQSSMVGLSVILNVAPTAAGVPSNIDVSSGAAPIVLNLPQIFGDADVNSLVRFDTNFGTVDVELFDQQVGPTTANFLKYVTGTTTSGGNYGNTIFHRTTRTNPDGIDVLQGGGFRFTTNPSALNHIATDNPIALQDILSNARGTISMARTSAANSGTSEFFFNTQTNLNLDRGGQGANSDGYAVFGVIRTGLSVVDAMHALATQNRGGAFATIPLQNYPNPPAGNFPTDTTTANYAFVNSVTVVRRPGESNVDALTFSVANNTNPDLVQVNIANGRVTLRVPAVLDGNATITLRATDRNGATVDATFTVNVTGAPP